MKVIAATFSCGSDAEAAKRDLVREFHLEGSVFRQALLGAAGQAADGRALLAGRLPDHVVSAASRIISRNRGEIVADVDAEVIAN